MSRVSNFVRGRKLRTITHRVTKFSRAVSWKWYSGSPWNIWQYLSWPPVSSLRLSLWCFDSEIDSSPGRSRCCRSDDHLCEIWLDQDWSRLTIERSSCNEYLLSLPRHLACERLPLRHLKYYVCIDMQIKRLEYSFNKLWNYFVIPRENSYRIMPKSRRDFE